MVQTSLWAALLGFTSFRLFLIFIFFFTFCSIILPKVSWHLKRLFFQIHESWCWDMGVCIVILPCQNSLLTNLSRPNSSPTPPQNFNELLPHLSHRTKHVRAVFLLILMILCNNQHYAHFNFLVIWVLERFNFIIIFFLNCWLKSWS